MTVMILSCAASLLLFRSVHKQSEELESAARAGTILSDAPIKTSLDIVIEAPPEKVWAVLTDVNRWPEWQTEIKDAKIAGPLQSGTTFTWTIGGAHMTSKIALVHPPEQIAWTGTAFNGHAVHIWKLQRLPGKRTRLRTDESMSGFLLPLFFSSTKLQASDQYWLECLKQRAER